MDGFKAVPTYDLRSATYSSPYIAFTAKEIYDHNNRPLDRLTPFEQDYVNRFDPTGGWPLTVINGQYAALGSGFSPALLQGQSFDAVRQEVQARGQSPGARAIAAETEVIVRYICASTGGVPGPVCPP